MVAPGKVVLYGILIWALAFTVAFLIFPLRESSRPLFESIMPVALTFATVGFGLRYLRRVSGGHAREGFLLGVAWMAINVAVDLPLMLSPSPMQMTFAEYWGDIGATYLIIPIITTGLGWARRQDETEGAERGGS